MMGFITWLKRKADLKKKENDAKAEALKMYYESDAYKLDIVNDLRKKKKEGKSNDFGAWLSRVSKNAAKSFNNETIKFDKDKLLGKK